MSGLLFRYIQGHFDVVTFDVFDTLIERDVTAPEDIFRLAGGDVLGAGGAEAFLERRRQAERAARSRRPDGEVTISEIYAELTSAYGTQCAALMDAEIRREIASCHAKRKMVSLMQACDTQKKDVYLISDMYLPSKIIAEMLSHCGIEKYRELYVSCEKRENKLNGALFRRVLEDHAIDPKRMIHFGDSVRADLLGSRRAGIRCVLLRRRGRLKQIIMRHLKQGKR